MDVRVLLHNVCVVCKVSQTNRDDCIWDIEVQKTYQYPLHERKTTNEMSKYNEMAWYGWRIVIKALRMGYVVGCAMWSKMGRSEGYGYFMWYDRSEHSQKIAGDGAHLRWFTMQQKYLERMSDMKGLGYCLHVYFGHNYSCRTNDDRGNNSTFDNTIDSIQVMVYVVTC